MRDFLCLVAREPVTWHGHTRDIQCRPTQKQERHHDCLNQAYLCPNAWHQKFGFVQSAVASFYLILNVICLWCVALNLNCDAMVTRWIDKVEKRVDAKISKRWSYDLSGSRSGLNFARQSAYSLCLTLVVKAQLNHQNKNTCQKAITSCFLCFGGSIDAPTRSLRG